MNNQEFYGIYINKKIPIIKDDRKINKYYRNIKLDFIGKAYILDKNEVDIKEELISGKKYKKNGKHIIKYINNEQEIYYINIKINKLWIILFYLLILTLILGCILFWHNNNIEEPKKMIEQIIGYDIELEGVKYVFDINYKNTDFKSLELTDKVTNQDYIYPGASGCFYVVINTKNGNRDMFYSMQIKEETNKPKNLKFETDGKTYNSMQELAEHIKGIIKKDTCKIIKIRWFWEYETLEDVIDTNDGMNFDKYNVLIRMIGNEKV